MVCLKCTFNFEHNGSHMKASFTKPVKKYIHSLYITEDNNNSPCHTGTMRTEDADRTSSTQQRANERIISEIAKRTVHN